MELTAKKFLLQIIMPTFGWRWLIALSSVPSIFILLLYGLAPESPRFLCMKGKTDEASSVLVMAAKFNGTVLPARTLANDQPVDQYNENKASETTHLLSQKGKMHSPSSLSVLFSSKLLKTNLLLWFLWFGNTLSYYGVILLTSELSSGQSKCTKTTLPSLESQDDSLYIDVFITSLAGNLEMEIK